MNASTNASLIQAANHESSPTVRCCYVYLLYLIISFFVAFYLLYSIPRDSKQNSILVSCFTYCIPYLEIQGKILF
jgi:hypothetical protein